MTSSLTLALTSNLNLTSISKYAPTPTPTTPSISMSMTPPMPMLKTSSQGVGPPLILPNQSDVNVDTASISARSQDPDSTSLAPSTSHASTSRGHAPSDPFFSSASSSSSSAAHPLPSTSGSTPLRPTSRRPTVRSASKPPRRPRSSSGSSSMYTTTKRPRTVADISPSSPARDLLRPRPGLGLGNGLGPAIGLGLAPRPGQALGPRRRSHPWTNSPYSHDRTSISHIGSASPTSRDVRYLSPATGARTLSRLSPLSHHHQAQPQDSHHHPARPQSLDSSSPSGIRSRSASPLEPIPTLAFPPLTLPQPEDPTVLTLGLPQPSATTSGFTFTREDLVRFREGGYRRSHYDEDNSDHDGYGYHGQHSAAVEKHHDEDDDDNENEHGNGNDMGGHMVQNRARSQSQSQSQTRTRSRRRRSGTGLAARVVGVTPLKPRDDRMVLVEAAWRRWEETGWLSRGMGAIGARAFDKKGEPYKPNISQVTMIRLVLAASPLKKLPIKQIYEAVSERWPAFRMGDNTWKNSIRHQLSLQDYFVLEDRPPEEGGNGKGGYWRVKVGPEGKTLCKAKRSTRHDFHLRAIKPGAPSTSSHRSSSTSLSMPKSSTPKPPPRSLKPVPAPPRPFFAQSSSITRPPVLQRKTKVAKPRPSPITPSTIPIPLHESPPELSYPVPVQFVQGFYERLPPTTSSTSREWDWGSDSGPGRGWDRAVPPPHTLPPGVAGMAEVRGGASGSIAHVAGESTPTRSVQALLDRPGGWRPSELLNLPSRRAAQGLEVGYIPIDGRAIFTGESSGVSHRESGAASLPHNAANAANGFRPTRLQPSYSTASTVPAPATSPPEAQATAVAAAATTSGIPAGVTTAPTRFWTGQKMMSATTTTTTAAAATIPPTAPAPAPAPSVPLSLSPNNASAANGDAIRTTSGTAFTPVTPTPTQHPARPVLPRLASLLRTNETIGRHHAYAASHGWGARARGMAGEGLRLAPIDMGGR